MYYKETDISNIARIMMKPPARTLSKKDRNMLEEIQEYCEEKLQCRRKIIYDKFLDSSSKLKSKFQDCRDKCDNCLIKSGKPRSIPTISSIDNKYNSKTNAVPFASFRKASSLMKSSSSNSSSLKPVLALYTKSNSSSSSSSTTTTTVNNKRNISVYDDDFDDDFDVNVDEDDNFVEKI
jgi:superfamily II DNA helicase RecQ